MSSTIKVHRVCNYCGNEFEALKTTTKYCSHKCNSAAYKAKKRAEKVNKSNIETHTIKQKPIEEIKAKDFLSVLEASKLIGISKRTVYRLIEQNELKKIKIGSRTIIRQAALYSFIDKKETAKPIINRYKP